MARLVLLNGLPGVGKSTVARRWAAESGGRAVVDPDEFRRNLDPASDVAEAARAQALSAAATHLASGTEVALPQLVGRLDQLERFERAADAAGATFVHVVLVDAAGDPLGRFHRRTGDDAWHAESRALVAADGGDDLLRRYAAGVDAVITARPDVVLVRSAEGDPADTVAALRAVLG